MGDIYQILSKERNEESHIIYLYRKDEYWCAYERSAFYISSICGVDAVFKTVDSNRESIMLTTILKNRMNNMTNPHFTIMEQSETNMVISCRITCKGFLYWKESFIPLLLTPYAKEVI